MSHSFINSVRFLLVFAALGSVSLPSSASTLTVPAQYTTIQAAINASVSGDTVLIADGTYTGPGNVDVTFAGRNITVTSQHGATNTIINCAGGSNAQHRGFLINSGETGAIISGVTIENGYESGEGGGILAGGVVLTVQNCIIQNNLSSGGGGIYNYDGGGGATPPANAGLTVINCVLTGNTGIYGGGGIYNVGSLTVTNSTLTGNLAPGGSTPPEQQGGGIFDAAYPPANSTITLTNDILYGDTGGELNGAVAAVSYCDIQGGYQAGSPPIGDINADPLFVNSPTDLHLGTGSPCLGAGTATSASATTLDGRSRPNPPSIGAYEGAVTTATVSTTTALTSSLNPSVIGQNVTFTATVTGSGGVPTGTITFTADGVVLAHTALSNGTAAFSTSSLTISSHVIRAAYSGDAVFLSSTSPAVTQIVNPASTTTTLSSSLNPSSYSQQISLFATVTGSSPTGIVTFTDINSGVTLGTASLSGGVATFNTFTLSGGIHQIVASYGGDSSNSASTSPSFSQTISQVGTTTTFTSSLNPSILSQSVTFKATVTANSGAGYATGTITYTIDGIAQPPVLINHSYSTSSLTLGAHTITVFYSGDLNYTPSTSATLTQTVVVHISPQYVSPSGADSNIGTQAAPKLTIQAAINATLSGDTVVVEDGKYTGPGNVDLDFGGRNIAVTSQNGAAQTVIDCQGTSSSNHRGFYLHSKETGALIGGLTIENGYEGNGNSGDGGGLLLSCKSVTVQNCILTGNFAGYGGGIESNSGVSAIINCFVSGNSASVGGGLYNYLSSAFSVTGCTVGNNQAVSSGGGIYNVTSSSNTTSVTNCMISGNSAGISGGGVSNQDGTGGMTALTNCVLTGNIASYGSGIDNDESESTTLITNCTLIGNPATGPNGGSVHDYTYDSYGLITLTNNIVYGDNGPEVVNAVNSGSSAVVSNCDIQGGYVGTSNINSDPLFVNSSSDLHLGPGSPCLGAGTASGAPTTTIDGKMRPNPPSIGAYEGALVATTLTVANVAGTAGQTITLSAALAATSSGGLSGKTLSFSVDGVGVGSAVTTITGTASLTYTIIAGANTGAHSVVASFAGDSSDLASSGTGTLTVSAPMPVGQVRFCPRAAYPSRMVGGQFQGSSDKVHWSTLAAVTQTPPVNQYSTLTTSADPAAFRYLRYLAPNGSYGNVAEIEFDSHGIKLTGTGFGTAGSYNNNGNTFSKALDGNTSTYFDAPAPGNGDFVGIDRGALTFTKLTGTAFGTAGSYNNDGNTFVKVFDGSLSTFFDAPVASGDYAGVDLGVGQAASVTHIGYCPRSGYASRMVGGVFQGSNDNAAWTTLYTVTSAPPSGVLTQTTAISSGTTYRYLRYSAPNGSYGNVAEVEFDTSP